MEMYWEELVLKAENDTLKGRDKKIYKQLVKAILLLEHNPRHTGLQTHEIKPLSIRYNMKVWQSYLENNTPGAGRIFWVYGPDKKDITIIGIEPHPDDKKHAYEKITLSELGD